MGVLESDVDVKRVFRSVSKKLVEDFKLSAEINHSGAKGTYRESSLRDFLASGRLPMRYGIGSGEIVGPARNVSRQSDLVVFDKLNGLALLLSESVQVYPIESVFGIVEVKSSLSKEELLKGLENIKSVKALTPKENIVQRGPVMTMSYARPAPFGIIFAYRLANNSLDSLASNLREWETNNPPEFWPNLVVVLGEGVLHHHADGLQTFVANKDITAACRPSPMWYRDDTLFQFYISLLDLCAQTHLGAPELRRYYDPAEQLGQYLVRNHDRVQKLGPSAGNSVYRLNLAFVDRVVKWCKAHGKISQRDVCLRQFGSLPLGMDEEWQAYEVYLYDPEALPGFHQVENPIVRDGDRVHASGRLQMPSHWIEVDHEIYNFSWAYVTDGDIEPIEGRTKDDL